MKEMAFFLLAVMLFAAAVFLIADFGFQPAMARERICITHGYPSVIVRSGQWYCLRQVNGTSDAVLVSSLDDTK